MDEVSEGTAVGSVVELGEAVEAFAAAAVRLVGQPQDAWDRIGPVHREQVFRVVEQARRSLGIVDVRFLCSHEREMPVRKHRQAAWLTDRFGLCPRDARARVSSRCRLDARGDALSADPSAPRPEYMPRLEAALIDGCVDIEAVAAVDAAVAAAPAEHHHALAASVDRALTPVLRDYGMADLKLIRPWIAGLLGAEGHWSGEDHRRLRGFTIGAQQQDGMSPVRGLLTPHAAAVLQRLMADHAKAGDLCVEEPGEDLRTPEQRRHDALLAVAEAGYGRGLALPTSRGATTIVAAMTVEQLLSGQGAAPTDVGVRVPVESLRATTDAADLFCQAMDFTGRTLALGRSRRLGSLDQYLALVGEEGVGSSPGSSTPPALCQIHHIDGWEYGGPTDLDNLGLVAPGPHARVNDRRDSADRWETRRGTDGRRVDWIPPVSEDPRRRPREGGGLAGWDCPGRIIRDRGHNHDSGYDSEAGDAPGSDRSAGRQAPRGPGDRVPRPHGPPSG